ncbi:MAG: carbohydrate ABC transporter permease [Oscillospiraceae bacterium]|nr:carbohydrate ABC transporter permease [Oscillospiraceae bacterium]MDY3792681.1 carbohydrate ABC transporter permease [Oscillospiraceae bacterium]MDY6208939.1 carbohydrate ABC transporter permease [Oscillospiraceae bacterium]
MSLAELKEKRAEEKRFKEHTTHIKLSWQDVVFNIFNYLFFGLFTLSCIFPFYYIFINTISASDLVVKGAITFLPKNITLQNYIAMGNVNDLWNSFVVTILRTVIGTALMVFASGLAGYLMTKQEMWHRKFWYRFLVITMYFNAGLIPAYLNFAMLGLTNTFWVYIIPGIVSPYNIILVKTYVESIPHEIEESAFMDGAGYWTIFQKIIWPLSKPILATITIFGAVGHWNSFQDSLIYNANSPELYTLQHRLYVYLNSSSNLGALMNGASAGDSTAVAGMLNTKVIQYTISMVTIIPILLVYPFMQKYFEKGIMLGAVKG